MTKYLLRPENRCQTAPCLDCELQLYPRQSAGEPLRRVSLRFYLLDWKEAFAGPAFAGLLLAFCEAILLPRAHRVLQLLPFLLPKTFSSSVQRSGPYTKAVLVATADAR